MDKQMLAIVLLATFCADPLLAQLAQFPTASLTIRAEMSRSTGRLEGMIDRSASWYRVGKSQNW